MFLPRVLEAAKLSEAELASLTSRHGWTENKKVLNDTSKEMVDGKQEGVEQQKEVDAMANVLKKNNDMVFLQVRSAAEIASYPRSRYGILEPPFEGTDVADLCQYENVATSNLDACVKASIHALDESLSATAAEVVTRGSDVERQQRLTKVGA